MHFVTIFDVGQHYAEQRYLLSFMAIPLLGGVGLVFIFPNRRTRKRIAWITGLVAVLVLIAMLSIGAEQRRLADLLQSGGGTWVEGRIDHFAPGNRHDHAHESFDVNGTRFSFDPNAVTPAFHLAAGDGGPLHEGLQVRIAAIDTDIVRIDTAVQNGAGGLVKARSR